MQLYYYFFIIITSSSLRYIYVNVESVIQLKFNSHFRCGGALSCAAIGAQWAHTSPTATDWSISMARFHHYNEFKDLASACLVYTFVQCNFKLYLYTYIVVLKHIWVYRYFNIVKYTCKPANYELLHVGPVRFLRRNFFQIQLLWYISEGKVKMRVLGKQIFHKWILYI